MKMKVNRGSICTFVIEVDCELCETVKKISKAGKIATSEVIEIALLGGLHGLTEKHLKKEN